MTPAFVPKWHRAHGRAEGQPDQPSSALAIPRGPVNGFAQACDLYDAVGINHHPEYMDPSLIDTAISRIQELGLRHVRLGMYSPADHGAFNFYSTSGTMGQHLAAANIARGGGVQPISALWGTTEEPAYEQTRQDQNRAIYTITLANGTFLRPLDGPAGSVGARSGTSWINGVGSISLENAGQYYNQGWETAGGLQGPNEPDNSRPTFWTGPGSVRDTLRRLKDAKNVRSTEVVLAGEDYVDSSTGRIASGPAYATQLPVVAPHLVFNGWASLGTADALSLDSDVGNRHTYWGGHGPNYTELAGQWAGSTSYTGMPRFCTETGVEMRPGYDGGPGQTRFAPADVSGEYIIRSIIVNYLQGVRRTYIYKLCDESAPLVPPWNFGLADINFARRAAFYAIKNFMALIGFVEGTTSAPITCNVTGFTPGADKTLGDGYVMPDRLDKLVIQRSPTEYLVFLVRQREIWDRGLQAYITVPDPKPVTLTFPGVTLTSAGVAEPAKNPILDPHDGQIYANANDGTAYQPLTVTGGNSVTLTMAGLTRVVRVVLTSAAGGGSIPASPPTGLTQTTVNTGQLSWTAGANAVGYDLFRNGSLRSSPSGTTVSDSAATGATYKYAVRSRSADGGRSLFTRTIAATVASDAMITRVLGELAQWTTWLSANGAAGFLGEFGWPADQYAAGDSAKWNLLAGRYYDQLRTVPGLWTSQWGASQAFTSYELAPYTGPGVGSAINATRPQSIPLENHFVDGVRGLAITGLEFGDGNAGFSNSNPGTLGGQYFDEQPGSWAYLYTRGVRFARIGFRWERLQPTLGGALNTTYLNLIKTQIAHAKINNMTVVLDCHNYGEYWVAPGVGTPAARTNLGDAGMSANFADLWTRLSGQFAGDPTVVAYGIMNEPNTITGGAATWQSVSQAAVTAIRATGDTTTIAVGGYQYSKVQGWATQHPTAWITGSNIRYEAHHYWDTESSTGGRADSAYGQTYASALADATANP